jgi:tetratricopeptide (TPR) repeat protein
MKKLLIFTILFIFISSQAYAEQSFANQKRDIIALYSANKLEDAYNMISKIPEDERDYEIWYLLGNLSQDFNNDTNAAFFLQKSIRMNPEFDKAHYNLANIYLKEKKYNSAVNEYKNAIKYKKDFPYYYYNLGCAYLGLKDYKNAKNEFEKAIKLKSNEADFYYNLAIAYKNLDKQKEAQNAIELYNKFKK